MQQTVAGENISVNVARAVSRLKAIFMTFDKKSQLTQAETQYIKDFNNFDHAMKGWPYKQNEELEYQIQIGSKMMPEYPVKSASQTWYELKKALGIHTSAFHSISPRFDQYLNHHFIVGLDCEKVLDASWTGLNTKAGDMLTVKIKGANGTIPAAKMPTKIYITLQSDNILEIRDSGATVFD